MGIRKALHRLRRRPQKPTETAGPIYHAQGLQVIGCKYCAALRELLSFEWESDRRRFNVLMDEGECYFTAEAVPQIRSEVADEFGLFQVMDQSTGAAATGTIPLWFQNSEMVDGLNEHP